MEIHLGKLLKRAKAINYNVTVDEKAKDWFVDEVFTSKFGVRALKRLIQEQVETPLSMLIMQERIHPGQEVFLGVDPSGRKLRVFAKAANKMEEAVPEPPKLEPEDDDIQTPEQQEDPVPDIRPPEEDREIISEDETTPENTPPQDETNG